MTQPSPEHLDLDPPAGSEPQTTPDLLAGRTGLVAVLASASAHESGWASRAVVALVDAALAAGHSAALMDLGLTTPSLHTAAGVKQKEGVSDAVLFGASLDRVSQWSATGARVVTVGTPIANTAEVFAETTWAELAREAADLGCTLAYLPAGTPGEAELLREAEDLILLRHGGDDLEDFNGGASEATASLIVEPPPVVEALDVADDSADDEVDDVADLEAGLSGAAFPMASPPEAVTEEVTDAMAAEPPALPAQDILSGEGLVDVVEEVDLDDVDDEAVDLEAAALEVADMDAGDGDDVAADGAHLDDVAGDSDAEAEPMFTAPSDSPVAAEVEDVTAEVGGLEVEPEWPAFDEPLVVQEPGDVDPLQAAGDPTAPADVDGALDDEFDNILADASELKIVADDLGTGDPATLGELFDAEPTDTESMDGLVDSTLETLQRAEAPSADEPVQADGPPGWDLRETEGMAEESAQLEDPWGEPVDLGPVEVPTAEDAPAEGTPREREPMGGDRLEPLAAASAPVEEPPAVDLPEDSLPWDSLEVDAADPEVPDVPVAEVTRTRTRTRTRGPRPFLLILLLLLVATIAVLSWAGLLDVAGLDFLRGGTP